MNAGEDSDLSTSVDIEADDVDDNNTVISDPRTCRKTSYPHVFQLYMFSTNLFSPGTFSISSSNKFYWQRIAEAHNISSDLLNAEILKLNRCVLWYMLLPKLLWIIPWICLPIGVVIYAVEDGYSYEHKFDIPPPSQHELDKHLSSAYNGLFIFVGGGIGGVLLATQLWNHCWYLCIKAMAKKINSLNINELWFTNCVTFDIQCDIPVLAGRSYGRAYYKIVITIHHDYLLNDNNNYNNKDPPVPVPVSASPNRRPTIISLKQPSSFDADDVAVAVAEDRDAVSLDNATNTTMNDPSLDLFKSLHTSIRRRHESKGLNMSLGLGAPTELPRTVSVTMGQVPNPQQLKRNYVRPTKPLQTMQYQPQQYSNVNMIEDIKEELQTSHIEIDNDEKEDNKAHKHMKEKKHKHKKKQNTKRNEKKTKEAQATLKGKGTQSNSLFNIGGFVSKSVLNDKSTRTMSKDTRNKSKQNITSTNNKKDKSVPK